MAPLTTTTKVPIDDFDSKTILKFSMPSEDRANWSVNSNDIFILFKSSKSKKSEISLKTPNLARKKFKIEKKVKFALKRPICRDKSSASQKSEISL